MSYRSDGGRPIVEEDWGGSSPPPVTDGEALTLSNVRAVSIGGGPPIPTYTRPGLPFGNSPSTLRLACATSRRPGCGV